MGAGRAPLAFVRPSRRLQVELSPVRGPGGRRLTRAPLGAWAPQWSPTGLSLLVTEQTSVSSYILASVPVNGGATRRIAGPFLDVHASWSPDGRRIALVAVTRDGDHRYHLYLVPAQGRRLADLGVGEVQATRPAWSPDGRLIAFADYEGRVRAIGPDGDGDRTLATLSAALVHGLAWSPDGSRIVFAATQPPED